MRTLNQALEIARKNTKKKLGLLTTLRYMAAHTYKPWSTLSEESLAALFYNTFGWEINEFLAKATAKGYLVVGYQLWYFNLPRLPPLQDCQCGARVRNLRLHQGSPTCLAAQFALGMKNKHYARVHYGGHLLRLAGVHTEFGPAGPFGGVEWRDGHACVRRISCAYYADERWPYFLSLLPKSLSSKKKLELIRRAAASDQAFVATLTLINMGAIPKAGWVDDPESSPLPMPPSVSALMGAPLPAPLPPAVKAMDEVLSF